MFPHLHIKLEFNHPLNSKGNIQTHEKMSSCIFRVKTHIHLMLSCAFYTEQYLVQKS